MMNLTRRAALFGATATAVIPALATTSVRAAAPAAGKQAPGFYRYKIGDIEVTVVTDGVARGKLMQNFVTNVKEEEVKDALAAAHKDREIFDNTFTPVVLTEGRISLKVMTEVSELSTDNALTLNTPGSTQALTVPSIRTRRAETVLEIPSGGAMAMAGMLQEQTRQQINGFPGLMQLPVLGALFKSRDYVNRQTELMVLVTPYIVRATAQKNLSRPDDGFADASDQSTVLLGRLNRIYGVAGRVDPNQIYFGKYGYNYD